MEAAQAALIKLAYDDLQDKIATGRLSRNGDIAAVRGILTQLNRYYSNAPSRSYEKQYNKFLEIEAVARKLMGDKVVDDLLVWIREKI